MNNIYVVIFFGKHYLVEYVITVTQKMGHNVNSQGVTGFFSSEECTMYQILLDGNSGLFLGGFILS